MKMGIERCLRAAFGDQLVEVLQARAQMFKKILMGCCWSLAAAAGPRLSGLEAGKHLSGLCLRSSGLATPSRAACAAA